MNIITCTGRLGKDSETRQAGKGTVTGFSCAVDVGFGDRKQTVWYSVSMWGARGEALQSYLSKGTQVAVSGELSQREHDGKTYLEINANDITLLGGGQQRQEQHAPVSEDKDIPF